MQALFTSSNIKEILKIKETFPKLQAKKIENIQKIINGNDKSKPKWNMTMKGLSRKQVIVSINNKNKLKFIELFSTHITNLNRVLKTSNLKSWLTLYIWTKQVLSLSPIKSHLSLQTIEKICQEYKSCWCS